jgi:hypothetical protein
MTCVINGPVILRSEVDEESVSPLQMMDSQCSSSMAAEVVRRTGGQIVATLRVRCARTRKG